ncbi:hypothetical protein IWW56_005810 [Coemansia sp. RSA 2131]|nr:hypothetical protein IWW56_005810 [Coemansia sp. RSA 2131]
MATVGAVRSSEFDSEEQRIQYLENLFDMRINPIDNVDTAVIAVGSAMFGVTFLFLVVAWLKRNFRPIRAKNLPLTTALFIAGVLWFVGDIPMNGHVLLKGSFSNCKEWNIWVRVLFCFVYTTALISRCYALDRVFIQNRPTHGLIYYLPTVLLLAFVLVYSIVTEAMSSKLTIGYAKELELCSTTEGYVYVTLSLLWVNWLIIIFMMIRLRNIQSTFNEFYEFLFICAFGIAAMIKTNVVHYTHPKYPLVRGYRIAETLGDAFVINAIILIIIAYPVVMSMWQPHEYEHKWLLRLRTDGLQNMYDANMNIREDFSQSYARMNTSVNQPTKKMAHTIANPFIDMPEYALHVDQNGMATLRVPEPNSPTDESTAISRYSGHSMITVDEYEKFRHIL